MGIVIRQAGRGGNRRGNRRLLHEWQWNVVDDGMLVVRLLAFLFTSATIQ
jgi:hypothetical protein